MKNLPASLPLFRRLPYFPSCSSPLKFRELRPHHRAVIHPLLQVCPCFLQLSLDGLCSLLLQAFAQASVLWDTLTQHNPANWRSPGSHFWEVSSYPPRLDECSGEPCVSLHHRMCLRSSTSFVRIVSNMLGTGFSGRGAQSRNLHWTSSALILLATLCCFDFYPHHPVSLFLKIARKLLISRPRVCPDFSLHLTQSLPTIWHYGTLFIPPLAALFLWLWGHFVSLSLQSILPLFILIFFWLVHKCWDAPGLCLGFLSLFSCPLPLKTSDRSMNSAVCPQCALPAQMCLPNFRSLFPTW